MSRRKGVVEWIIPRCSVGETEGGNSTTEQPHSGLPSAGTTSAHCCQPIEPNTTALIADTKSEFLVALHCLITHVTGLSRARPTFWWREGVTQPRSFQRVSQVSRARCVGNPALLSAPAVRSECEITLRCIIQLQLGPSSLLSKVIPPNSWPSRLLSLHLGAILLRPVSLNLSRDRGR